MFTYYCYLLEYKNTPRLESLFNDVSFSFNLIAEQKSDLTSCRAIYCYEIQSTSIPHQEILALSLKYKFDFYLNHTPLLSTPKLVVFDMDSTLIPVEVIDELADFAGVKGEVSSITESAMRGEIDFDQSLIRRVTKLKGLSTSVISKIALGLKFNPGVEELCRYILSQDGKLAIASGGFIQFAEQLSKKIPFDYIRANHLTVNMQTRQLDGAVSRPIINAEMKAKLLTEWAAQNNLELSEVMAVGDGANDSLMIQESGVGVAYHAKPKLNSLANLILKHGQMDALIDLFVFAESAKFKGVFTEQKTVFSE